MEKAAHYVISGIWKAPNGVEITHVMLHPVDAKNRILPGNKMTFQGLTKLLRDGNIIRTIVWNYSVGTWRFNVNVSLAVGKKLYIKTYPDERLSDQFRHLIDMSKLYC